jgi:hypothetical protein
MSKTNKVTLVDRATGEERGWIVFEDDVMTLPFELADQKVCTVGAFCGFSPWSPPWEVHFL